MELAATALDLPPDYFVTEGGYAKPGCTLRLAHYLETPPAGAEVNQSRYNAHSDYDGFTFLSREALQGGLEIRLQEEGEWVAVAPPPGCLVVNIGDLLARWSNDRWKAALHRVATPSASDERHTTDSQLSVVFFSGPHPDTVIDCLPSEKCRGLGYDNGGGGAVYPIVTAGEHTRKKLEMAAGLFRD